MLPTSIWHLAAAYVQSTYDHLHVLICTQLSRQSAYSCPRTTERWNIMRLEPIPCRAIIDDSELLSRIYAIYIIIHQVLRADFLTFCAAVFARTGFPRRLGRYEPTEVP